LTANQAQQHGSHYLSVVGRIKKGVTVEQARTDMATIAERLAGQYPNSNSGWSTLVFKMQEYEVRDIKSALLLLLGAVVVVLLIACANVASMLLARSTARQKEIAIRAALGASRRRVIQQLLTESVLLSTVGGAAGLLVAMWGMKWLLSLAPSDLQN